MFDPTLPLEAASTIPAKWYTSEEFATLERTRVFGDSWICVGRADQVAKPGDFFTADVAGEPILVVRGEDGLVRGFFNVCRHRAARVIQEKCGHVDRLRCPYHAWTYDLTGRLRGVPEFDGVAGFTREQNGLSTVHVELWGPLVFIHMGEPKVSLQDHLSPMPTKLAPYQIENLRCVGTKEYILNCNWKVFVDNYQDGGYHVHPIHPSLASVLDYKNYRTECFTWTSVQSSPMKQPDKDDDATAAVVRTGQAASYWWAYPNLMLNAYEGVMDTNVVFPLGPNQCRVIFDFYFPISDTGPEAETRHAKSIEVADRIQAEDVGICEDVQRGLASRSFDTGRYSVRREAGVHQFHCLLARQVMFR
jgi:choline monooxygenase